MRAPFLGLSLSALAAACGQGGTMAPPALDSGPNTGSDSGIAADGGGIGGDAGADADAGPSCGPGPSTGDFPTDVGAAILAKCHACHRQPPVNHAPFPLNRYEDVIVPFGTAGKLRWQRMSEVIQPGSIPHMPLGNAPQLTQDEKKTLDDWFSGCAQPVPEGTGADIGGG